MNTVSTFDTPLSAYEYVVERIEEELGYEPIPEQIDAGTAHRFYDLLQEYVEMDTRSDGTKLYSRQDLDWAWKNLDQPE